MPRALPASAVRCSCSGTSIWGCCATTASSSAAARRSGSPPWSCSASVRASCCSCREPGCPSGAAEGVARILITGGSSVVGDYLLPRLDAAGHESTVLSRRAPAGARWRQLDAARDSVWSVAPQEVSHLIHLAPLPLLAKVLPGAPASLRRVVAIGTTSVFTKSASPSTKDRHLVQDQRQAEQGLIDFCRERGIGYTLLRPTLVYDGRRDKNVARIA